MDLTGCGMNIEKTEKIVNLYAEFLEWEKVKEKWHEKRLGGRGSRHSSQKVFHILKKRLQSGNNDLPSVKSLSKILDVCEKKREKAQIIYFYIYEKEGLFRFLVSKLSQNTNNKQNIDFSNQNLWSNLKEFRLKNGDKIQFSKATLERWFAGFRGVMREIGVIPSKQKMEGESPLVSDIVLQLASGYSWKIIGKNWLEKPIGWIALFQPEEKWMDLISRLNQYEYWELYEVQGKQRMKPKENPFKIGEIDET